MTMSGAARYRLRMRWTTVLVLIALGGAGFAVAADRPHNPAARPELTWRADRAAEPWIAAAALDLAAIDGHVTDLARAARDVLGRLQALDLDGVDEGLAAGEALLPMIASALKSPDSLASPTFEQIRSLGLSDVTRDRIEQIDEAALAAGGVDAHWNALAANARLVGGLVETLLAHDGLVFRATTAGRQERWDDALVLLAEAGATLDDAAGVRDELVPTSEVETLDDVLARYRVYDEALVALYTHVRDEGRRGARFEALEERVEQAQAALPTDSGVMSVIVGESAGPVQIRALVEIEAVQGAITDALVTIMGDQ